MRHHWKDYFIFSIKEQKGIIVLGFILLLSILVSLLLPKPLMKKVPSKKNEHFVLFKFDPNTIDSGQALLLGIPSKQISTLLHYRNKGGRFYRKEDLARLYGLKAELLEKLIPFVDLPEKKPIQTNSKYHSYLVHTFSTGNKGRFIKAAWTIDINEASPSEWLLKTNLPMNTIQRLIEYKQYLGGFNSIYQLTKVYGMTDSSFQLIRPHLIVKKQKEMKWVANFMTLDQWKSLGLFQDKEIIQLLKFKKEHAGKIGLRDLVLKFDLTEMQANWLQTKIRID
jgi:DNA uptake protein ComE-like DNA-binding protein